jgi:endonuclease/exonuclease/phosphatase family metal-dependent hydrolase
MKIISLNTWGGRAGTQGLLSFFERNEDADVFCLQEIWSAPYEHLEGVKAGGLEISHEDIMVYGKQEISKLLSSHAYYFAPQHQENYGLMTLIKEEYPVAEFGEVFVHKHKGFVPIGDVGRHARNVQFVETVHNGKKLNILNFHGLWNGEGKRDSEDRILQSENIAGFLKTLSGDIVFCGDFNLLPDTQSIKIIEDAGMRNLVKEYEVTSTRSSFYSKPEKFADYVFVSSGIEVAGFAVMQDQVSDHLPLCLEIR